MTEFAINRIPKNIRYLMECKIDVDKWLIREDGEFLVDYRKVIGLVPKHDKKHDLSVRFDIKYLKEVVDALYNSDISTVMVGMRTELGPLYIYDDTKDFAFAIAPMSDDKDED